MERNQLKLGMRVRSLQEQDRFPCGIFPAGEVGTITWLGNANKGEVLVAITMDKHFEWLSEWRNEMHWYDADEFDGGKFENYWEVIENNT